MPRFQRIREKGFILVIVLVVVAFITALVVEFIYGVHATTSNLKNWTESQRLSLAAISGVNLASLAIKEQSRLNRYTYPERVEKPLENIMEGFEGKVIVRIEDEGGRLNLNSLIMRNKRLNSDVYDAFKRLLRILRLDEAIADRVVDWMDEDSEPRVRDSEDGAKNSSFDSIDELLLIKGIDRETYDKLIPHITIYGNTDRMNININTATIPVIMSLSDMMTEEIAGQIVRQRSVKPFEGMDDPNLTAILGGLKTRLMGRIDVRSSFFHVISVAEESGMKRLIETYLEMRDDLIVRYWRES
jgi:general secretion pathway protein K